MVQESHDGSLGQALGDFIARAALGAVVGAVGLLALGLVAEVLRRRHRARRVLALLDLTLPVGVRAAVVSILAIAATLTGPRPGGAADSVRGWLGQLSTSTTSTTRTPVVAPGALAAHELPRAAGAPTGPVVLIPPVTAERLDPLATPPKALGPRTTTPTSPTRARVSPSTPANAPVVVVPPRASAAEPSVYVVKRGDCLWSIAARRLGARADARAIDISWRQIYALNRAAIGENPNLIHVGLTLELPPLVAQP